MLVLVLETCKLEQMDLKEEDLMLILLITFHALIHHASGSCTHIPELVFIVNKL